MDKVEKSEPERVGTLIRLEAFATIVIRSSESSRIGTMEEASGRWLL